MLALLVGGLAIGSSGIFVRISETGTTATAFWRGALAVPMFALWLLIVRTRRRPALVAGSNSLQVGCREPAMFWAGALFAADLALWHWSLMLTSVAAATLEACLAPLLITIFAWIAWGARPAPRFLAALALALAGLVLIVAPNIARGDTAFVGDLLGLSAACFYAGYIIAIARLRAAYRTAVVMLLTTLAFAVVLLPVALTQKFVPDTPQGWLILAALAFIAQFIGQGLIAYALAHLPATLGSVGIYMQPVAAALYAWVLLDEALQPLQVVGGIVTVCAIGFATAAGSSGQDPAIARRELTAAGVASDPSRKQRNHS